MFPSLNVSRRFLTGAVLLYVLLFGSLLPSRLAEPVELTFSSDAAEYNAGGVHLMQEGFYSVDGQTPAIEREPGMSAFLAVIYTLFGAENRLALFLVQGLLYLLAALALMLELQRILSQSAARLTLLFLISLPPILHSLLSAYREGFALILLLSVLAVTLSLRRAPSLGCALTLSLLLSALILTYIPFLFSPILLLALLWYQRTPPRLLLPILLLPMLMVAAWGLRNLRSDGQFRLIGSFRTTAMWYARAEQAEHLRRWQPLQCLYAEYVSRDWSGVPLACATNAIIHTRWPGRIPTGDESTVARESQRRILHSLPHYLWFSLFEIVELHLPFFDGWGRSYNIAALLSTVVLYAGLLLALPILRGKEAVLFLLVIAYGTVVFSLTDAIPRYLVPILPAYAAIAAMGYTHALHVFRQRRRSRS